MIDVQSDRLIYSTQELPVEKKKESSCSSNSTDSEEEE